LNVTVERGAGGVDTVNKVASGVAEFGLADLGTMMLAAEKNGAPVKALMPVGTESPFGIMTLKDHAITALPQLEGRSLAAGPGDSNIQVLPYAMKESGGDFAKVKFEQADFSALLGMLMQGHVDAFTTFKGTAEVLKPIAAAAGRDVNFFDYGKDLKVYGMALFANAGYLADNHDVARRLVKGAQCAFLAGRANPEAALDAMLQEFPDRKRDVEMSGIKSGIDDMFEPDVYGKFGFGWSSERVANTLNFNMAAHGVTEMKVKADELIAAP
jgi:NitT/TauT family transport system substrate-binding protein